MHMLHFSLVITFGGLFLKVVEGATSNLTFSSANISVLQGDFSSPNVANIDLSFNIKTPSESQNADMGSQQVYTNMPTLNYDTNPPVVLREPLDYISVTLEIVIQYFNRSVNPISNPNPFFTLSNSTWIAGGFTSSKQYKSVIFNFLDPHMQKNTTWQVSAFYEKTCNDPDVYGFNCDAKCVPQNNAQQCYNCDRTSGAKHCCAGPIYSNETECIINGSVPFTTALSTWSYASQTTKQPDCSSCQNTCPVSQKDYDDARNERKLFMWLMIGVAVLALILLLLALFCCCRAQHYKESYESIKNEFYDFREARTYRLRQVQGSKREVSQRPQIVHENPNMVSRDPTRASIIDQQPQSQRRVPPPYGVYRPQPTRPTALTTTLEETPVPPVRTGSYHQATVNRPAYEQSISIASDESAFNWPPVGEEHPV